MSLRSDFHKAELRASDDESLLIHAGVGWCGEFPFVDDENHKACTHCLFTQGPTYVGRALNLGRT